MPRSLYLIVCAMSVGMLWMGSVTALCPSARADVVVPDLPDKTTFSEADQQAAGEAYAKADKHLGRRHYTKALVQADLAWKAVPNASTALLNAVILGKMKRHRAAFKAYLLASDLSPTADELKFITAGLRKHGNLSIPKLGWLIVVADPENARVVIDNVSFDAPRAVGVSEGRHSLLVVAPQRHATRSSLDAMAGVGQRVEYRLTAKERVAPKPVKAVIPSAPAVKAEEPVVVAIGGGDPEQLTTSAEAADYSAPAYALVGTGVVMLAAGVGLHAWSFGRANDTDELATPRQDLDEELRRAQHQQAESDMALGSTLAFVGYGLGVAALTTGIVLLLLEPESEAVVSPVALRGGAGLQAMFRY